MLNMKPSSARVTHSLLRTNRSTHYSNDDRPPFSTASQSGNFKSKNQAWPDTAANFSTEGSDFRGSKSPNNPGVQQNTFKEYRGRNDRPVTFNETQSSPNMTSPTSVRFKQGTMDYSPNMRPSGREKYEIERENNMLSGSLERTNGGQRNDNQPRNYVKLEKEITELKHQIIGRLSHPQEQKEKGHKAPTRELSSSSSSSEEANRVQAAKMKKANRTEGHKGGKSNNNDSKIKIYDEEDVLVEEPETKDLGNKRYKEEERTIEKNIDGLGKALKRKEKKYSDLKNKYKEMKTILKSYVNKVIDLEEALQNKEEELNNVEAQRKSDQKKLQKSNDLIQELKSREDALQKSEGNAIDSSVEYKSKYLEQKEELKKLRGLLEEAEEKFKQVNQDNKEMRGELESYKGKETSWKEKNETRFREIEGLERELETSKNLLERYEAERNERESQMKALREELERVRNEKNWLEQRADDNNKGKQEFEAEFIKFKRKTEDEAKKVLEDKEKELVVKKEKMKRLKEKAREYERLANKLSEEKKFAEFEIEKLAAQKANAEKEVNKAKEEAKNANKEMTGMKTNLDSLKSQFNETYETLRLESTRTDNTQGDLKKLTKQLKIAETKLGLRDRDVEKYEEKNLKLTADVKGLLEETTRSREYIAKLEDRVAFLQMHQSEEISKVEVRIEEFYREIYALREENKVLKAREVGLIADIDLVSQERDLLKRDYKEMKHSNKYLEKELRSLNRNMKEVIDEKILEISHHSRGYSSNIEKDAKLEALGEVQDMIKSLRHSSYKFEN